MSAFRRSVGYLARRTGLRRMVNWCRRRVFLTRMQKIHGVWVRIPAICGISCDVTEPWMTEVLARLLPGRSGMFLDVGANVGQTLVKVKAIDLSREYIGFEPNPSCVFYLTELCLANRYADCTIIPVGLFTEDAVLALDIFSDALTDSAASVIKDFRPNQPARSRIFVPVFRYAAVAGILAGKPVAFIKIDVEGAELEVVRTLEEVIRRDKPWILIEILPVYSEENTSRRSRQEELERFLFDLEYAMLLVEKTTDGGCSGLREIATLGIHSDLSRCDYLLVPWSDVRSVLEANPGMAPF